MNLGDPFIVRLPRLPGDSELGWIQELHAVCLATWIQWVISRGWRVRLSEGFVGDSIDKPAEDSPHRRGGGHFRKTAVDVNLMVQGQVARGNSREWAEAEAYWLSLHPLCRTAGPGDRGHLGMLYRGII